MWLRSAPLAYTCTCLLSAAAARSALSAAWINNHATTPAIKMNPLVLCDQPGMSIGMEVQDKRRGQSSNL
jgi:hypothetical protein